MLHLIGIGLKPEHLTEEALECINQCDVLYLETYTSMYGSGRVEALEKKIGKKIFRLNREQVEEKAGWLGTAQKNEVGFLVYGNVFSATTHIQLVLDAHAAGIKTHFVPGISVFNYLGSLGLDEYRFGRVCTIVFPEKGFAPDSFMDTIQQNRENGLHTLCLLDIRKEEQKMMGVREGMQILEGIAHTRGMDGVSEWRVLGIAAAGNEGQEVKAGRWETAREWEFSLYPQMLVVCGRLTEKEQEALTVLYGDTGNGKD